MTTIAIDAFFDLYCKGCHFVVDDGYLRHHHIIPKDFEVQTKPSRWMSHAAHVEYKQGLVLETQNDYLTMRTWAQSAENNQLNAQVLQLQQIAQNYVHHFKYLKFQFAHGFQFAREGLEYKSFIKNFASLAPSANFDNTQGALNSVVSCYNWKGKRVYVDIQPTDSKENVEANQPIEIPFVRIQFRYPSDYGSHKAIAQELNSNYEQAKKFVDNLSVRG